MAQQTVNNGDSGLVARNKINSNFTEVYGRHRVFAQWDATVNSLPVDADGVGSGEDGALQTGDEFFFGPGGGTIDGEAYPENTFARYLGSGWRLY